MNYVQVVIFLIQVCCLMVVFLVFVLSVDTSSTRKSILLKKRIMEDQTEQILEKFFVLILFNFPFLISITNNEDVV